MRFFLTCLTALLLLAAQPGQAQTLAEWFRQKDTQREYLVQQIAALQAYAGALRQGYSIVRQGTSTVEHIKQGDLGLHQAFFGSLRLVNPALAGSARAADILTYQGAVLRDFQVALPALLQQGLLTPVELRYLEEVKARVLADCARDLESLWLVLQPGEAALTDQERWQRLEALSASTQDTFRFTRAFLQEARLLVRARRLEQQGLNDTRTLYSITP